MDELRIPEWLQRYKERFAKSPTPLQLEALHSDQDALDSLSYAMKSVRDAHPDEDIGLRAVLLGVEYALQELHLLQRAACAVRCPQGASLGSEQRTRARREVGLGRLRRGLRGPRSGDGEAGEVGTRPFRLQAG